MRFPRTLEWFWLDINLHLPHHVAPKIPFYHLREAARAIQQNFPNRVNPQTTFRLSLLTEVWKQPFLSHVKNP